MKVDISKMKLTAAARDALKATIRVHPDAAKFVKSSAEVSSMTKASLLSLAESLNIDVQKVAAHAEVDARAATGAENLMGLESGYAFQGHIGFDLELRLLGKVVTRQARLVYDHTPEWNYFDIITGTERLGRGSWMMSLEVLAILEGEAWISSPSGKSVKRKNDPTWTRVDLLEDGVLPEAIYDEFEGLIDKACREQDALNRSSWTNKPVIER